MSQDLFQSPDYFLLDELLTDEHKLIRETAREWVKKEISPIIEEACQKSEFPKEIIKGLKKASKLHAGQAKKLEKIEKDQRQRYKNKHVKKK